MRINLILFSSELHDTPNILEARSYLFDNLRAFCDINIMNAASYTPILEQDLKAKEPKKRVLTVLFIASGGTEEMFLNLYPFLKQPIIILSDGYHNSFAAACEICTWLANNSVAHTALNIPIDPTPDYFQKLKHQFEKIHRQIMMRYELNGERIGLIGGSSSWLISSQVDKGLLSAKYGVVLIDIKNTELADFFFSIKNENRNFTNDPLVKKYGKLLIGGRTQEDLINAIILYYALKEICTKYSLNALTIKCFDIIELCHTTACLATAILNDNGIVAGCEGDIPSLITMMVVKKGGNICSFMANPSSADKTNLTVDFSHCTLPLSMTESFELPSHFESSLGIGIKGTLPLGEYYIIKIGGTNMEKYFICKGKIINNPNLPMRCRTQVRFQFKSRQNFDMFMASRLGNHFIIFKGDN